MTTSTDLPEFFAIDSQQLTIGRAASCDVRIASLSVSLKHATIQRRGNCLWITDCNSRFGTFVNGQRIGECELSVGDNIRFGTALVYHVEPAGIRLGERPDGVSLSARGVDLRKGEFLAVHDASFRISPNSMIGIVGPSGSGKSTLLQSLAGYLPPTQGRLTADDREIYSDAESHQQALGYVAQDDVVFPTLTIRENLVFAAELRFGATDRGDLNQIVERVIESVGLRDVADNIHYSGGQRKRLSVAIELLKRPRLLLLDEPTSGLDYASEAKLMSQLHQLTEQGTTVVCTTHHLANLDLFDGVIIIGVQDSPEPAKVRVKSEALNPAEVLQLLDNVIPGAPPSRRGDIKLKVGRIAYAGPPSEAFKSLDCDSFARLFERLNTGRFKPDKSGTSSAVSDSHRPVGKGQNSAVSFNFNSLDNLKQITLQTIGDAGAELSQLAYDASAWRQVILLLKRFALIMRRDPAWLLAMIGQPVALAFLVGISQFRTSANAAIGFFLVVLAVWFGMNNSVRDLVRERKAYVREKLAGLSPPAFYLSRALAHVSIGVVQVLLLLATIGVVGAVTFSVDTKHNLALLLRLPYLWLVLALCHFGGVGIGLLISAAAKSEESAVATLPLVIVPQVVLSAMATGQVDVSYASPRPFRPLVSAFANPHESWAASLVDFLSLACISRPGTLLIESPQGWRWMGDMCHLVILLAAIWVVAYLVFLREQRLWPKYSNLG